MNQKNNLNPLFILTLIFPGMAFLYSIKRIWYKQYQKIILVFFFWFGYSIIFYGGDINEYKNAFEITSTYQWHDYFYLVGHAFSDAKWDIYQHNTVIEKPDYYALTLQFLVTRFTTEVRWFFAFASLIYCFIFLRFLNEVLRVTGIGKENPQKILLVSLLVLVPFYVGVSGVRFWPALFLFLLFVLKYYRTGKLYYIALSAVSIAFHYTFMVPVGIFLLAIVMNISKRILVSFVIGSVLFFTISSTTNIFAFTNTIIEEFGESSVAEATEAYTNEDVLAETTEIIQNANWYVKAREVLVKYSFLLIFMLDFFGFFKWRTNRFLESWYSLYVLFFCFALITSNLGSIGRFMYVFQLLCIIRLGVIAQINGRKNIAIKNVTTIMVPIMLLHFLVSLRAGFYFVDPLLFVGNPIVFFFVHSSVSLSEIIVGH